MTTRDAGYFEYNATVQTRDEQMKVVRTGLALVDDEGYILRANGLQTYDGSAGTRAFHERYMSSLMSFECGLDIIRDGGETYKNIIRGFGS